MPTFPSRLLCDGCDRSRWRTRSLDGRSIVCTWCRHGLRRTEQESPSYCGATGYWNIWGGFHASRWWRRGLLLAWLTVKHPKAWRFTGYLLSRWWVHRACDTTDFDHWCCLADWRNRFNDHLDRWWASRARDTSRRADEASAA